MATTTPSARQRLSSSSAARRAKLLDGLETLRTSAPVQQLLSEKTLIVLAGAAAPLGLILVFYGWLGASRTPNTFEQIPYLISGGLFGLGLTVLGGFFYFAHWIAELVKEQRRQTETLVAAIDELRQNDELSQAIVELTESLRRKDGRAPKASRSARPAHRSSN